MTEEAIILAGGLGTRLQSVVKDVPKPMAEVAGRPFLNYIMFYLSKNNIKKAILAVGHKYEIIQEYLKDPKNCYGIEVRFSIEKELLGTGGAIFEAFKMVVGESAFIVNGDTYFEAALNDMEKFALSKSAKLVFALKETDQSNRYGSVKCSNDGQILSFTEKEDANHNKILINGGIYYMKKCLISEFPMPQKFSIEQDFFQKKLKEINAYGKAYQGLFIDIGVPEDYKVSQKLLRTIIQN